MDPFWVLLAFILGFVSNRVGLPPLVGYLVAGFVLNAFGVQGGETLERIADLGVTLLLFSIGLKLRVRSLARPEVWAGAAIHMLITVIIFGVGIYLLGAADFSVFSTLDFKCSLLIAFALSFSSTVFAVKVLEEKGEMSSLHGRVSIGILIMQDIFAVIFLTVSTGKIPSPWAIVLVVSLLAIRPLLMAILDRCGHRELLLLFGIFLALGLGHAGFEFVGLKGDLGALIAGALVSTHPKAEELSKVLLSFKDLFLVGFFLSIGISGNPTLQTLGIAALLTVATVFKVALFFVLLTRFRLRSRTALLGSFSLANYSEFGLLVSAIGAKNGWIGNEWLIIIAIALSITFILAAPVNTAAHSIYARFSGRLRRYETKTRHRDDEPLDPGDSEIVIFGMGRIGTSAYEYMRDRHGEVVVGVDFDAEAVKKHRMAGRKVVLGDPTDPDFWEGAKYPGKIRVAILAMPNHTENMYAAKILASQNFTGLVSATARFDDEVAELKEAGVHAAFNLYTEAGIGFAEHVQKSLEERLAYRFDE